MADREQTLRSMPWAATLSSTVIDWLAGAVDDVEFAAGDALITQGDEDRDCYFLVAGEVEVVIAGSVVATAGPGEPEGEMALLYRQRRRATVAARTPIRALRLAAMDFDALAAEDPASAQVLADALIAYQSEQLGMALPAWKPD